MNQAEHAKKLRAINSANRTFWNTFQKRLDKLIKERPQVVSDALADFNDEARRRGLLHDPLTVLREMPSLEYFIERASKRTLSPKKRGRPQGASPESADLRERIAQLKQKHSWSEVSRRLANEGIHLSASGCCYYKPAK